MDPLVREYDSLLHRLVLWIARGQGSEDAHEANIFRADLVRGSIPAEDRDRLDILHGVRWSLGRFLWKGTGCNPPDTVQAVQPAMLPAVERPGCSTGWHTFGWIGDKFYGSDEKDMRWACAQLGEAEAEAEEAWWYEVVRRDGSVAFSGECSSRRSAELAVERFVHSTGGDVAERFANWLVRNREKRGLSRGQIAKRAGLNHSTVRAIELGENEPKEATRKVLEALFDEEHGQVARIEKLERQVRLLTRRIEAMEG